MKIRKSVIDAFLCMCAVSALAFETPVTPGLLDNEVTAEWVDGSERPVPDFRGEYNIPHWPNALSWVVVMPGSRLGHGGIPFGENKGAGPQHLRIGFTEANRIICFKKQL